MCVEVWGRDEYRVGVREWHGTVRAKTARSGVRRVRIKQGHFVGVLRGVARAVFV